MFCLRGNATGGADSSSARQRGLAQSRSRPPQTDPQAAISARYLSGRHVKREDVKTRHTGKSRALYYEYGLGSARECRDWYYKSRHILDPTVVSHRLDISTRIIRLSLTMIDNERRTNRKASRT